jgi:hypothetical protein
LQLLKPVENSGFEEDAVIAPGVVDCGVDDGDMRVRLTSWKK